MVERRHTARSRQFIKRKRINVSTLAAIFPPTGLVSGFLTRNPSIFDFTNWKMKHEMLLRYLSKYLCSVWFQLPRRTFYSSSLIRLIHCKHKNLWWPNFRVYTEFLVVKTSSEWSAVVFLIKIQSLLRENIQN